MLILYSGLNTSLIYATERDNTCQAVKVYLEVNSKWEVLMQNIVNLIIKQQCLKTSQELSLPMKQLRLYICEVHFSPLPHQSLRWQTCHCAFDLADVG